MSLHVWFLPLFFPTASCERCSCMLVCVYVRARMCVCARTLTGDLSRQSAAYIYPSLLSLSSQWRGAEGWGAQTGQHRSSLRREKLGMKLKLPSKARANAVTWSSTIYTPRRCWWWWWCLHHVSDNRTNTRGEGGRGRGTERESLPSICSVPLTCHHLYCQGPSARLAPSWAPINHSPAGRRKAVGPAKLCWWESIYRSGRLKERENGLVSKWLINKKCRLQKIVSKYNATEFRLDGKMCLCTVALLV